MIGIPTPTCTPSPNFSETWTGLVFGRGALLLDELDGLDGPVEDVAPLVDCVPVVVGPPAVEFEPHADTTSAVATSAATTPGNGRNLGAKGIDIT